MRYASMRSLDISNGENVGVSLFVQGCHFHCYNCFNSDAWDFNGGKKWTEETENRFMELINRPYIKRVSILGGEPLADENVEVIYGLLRRIKNNFPTKKIWIYTGYWVDDIIKDFYESQKLIPPDEPIKPPLSFLRFGVLTVADVIVDGKFVDALKDPSLLFKGSENQRVINLKNSNLAKNTLVLWTPEGENKTNED